MRIALFLPENDEAKAVEKALADAFPKAIIFDPDKEGEEREDADRYLAALEEQLGSVGKEGIILVNPPVEESALTRIDKAFRERLGRNARPRAVFFAPPFKKKDQDPYAEYREHVRPAFRHFHKDARMIEFAKLAPKTALKASRLARKSSSVIRWGALMPAAGFFLIVIVATFLLRDIFAKRVFLDLAESTFRARAEALGFATTFLPGIRVDKFAIADRKKPMENLIEFDRFEADIDLAAAFSGLLHVEEASLEGLRFHTPRSESGALDPAEAPPAEEPVTPTDFNAALESILDGVVEMFAPPKLEDLETVKTARRIEKECKERFARLEASVKALDLEGRYKKTKDGLEGLTRRKPPESFRKVRDRLKEFKSMKFGAEQVEAVRAGLQKAASVALADEKMALERARSDLLDVKQTIDKTRDFIKRAKRIKRVTILDIPQVKNLLEDLDDISRRLGRVQGQLTSAANAVEKARKGLLEKKARLEKSLSSNRQSIETARATLKESAPKIHASLESLKGDLEGAKADFEVERNAVMEALASLEGEMNALVGEALKLKDRFEGDLTYLLAQREVLTRAVETDRKNLMDRYGLESFEAESILKALVGEDLAGWLVKGYRIYELLKPYLEKESDVEKVEARPSRQGGGTTFDFSPAETAEPRVWIKHARFSGVFPFKGRDYVLSGTASNLSTDVHLTLEPVKISFEAKRDGEMLKGAIELAPNGRMTIHIEATGFKLSGVRFKGRYVPKEIKADSMDIVLDAAFEGKWMEAKVRLGLSGLRFVTDFRRVDGRIASVLEKVFEGITEANAEIAMTFEGLRVTGFKTETDLADRVAGSFRKALSEEIEEVKREALALLDEKTVEPMAGARAAVDVFSKNGGSKVEPAVRESSSMKSRFATDKNRATGRLEELGKLLQVEDDPAKTIAEKEKDLDSLETKLSGIGTDFARDREAQEALLGEVTKLLEGEKGRKDQANKDLKSEIERLKKLLKKALPF